MNTFENLPSLSFNFPTLSKMSSSMHSLPSDETDHVSRLKSDLISTDGAIKSSKDIYFNQCSATSEGSGANPKSKHGKSVSWASELTTSPSTLDDGLEEQCLQLITALRQEKSFEDTPSMQAAKWMIENDSDKPIVELIAIYLHLKLERYPSGKEIMDMFDREGFTENSLTSLISKHCHTNSGGLSTLKSILKTFHANDTSLEHESSQTATENLNSISLALDCLTAAASSLSSSSEVQQCNSNEMQSLFREEQKNFLKLEALKKEQSYLKHSLTCLICKQRQIDTMLLPCGHVVLCSVCSESCYSCPVCKKTALAEVKTYLS